jgi:hypothetical protein
MPKTHASFRFPAGRIVITANAASVLSDAEIRTALRRHLHADWGDLSFHDIRDNERALRHGGRLCSAYRTDAGRRFYVITECDRSVTTLLFPEDY